MNDSWQDGTQPENRRWTHPLMDPSSFGPIPPEVAAHNRMVAEWHADRPNAWDFPADVVRAGRENGTSIFGFPQLSHRARVASIPGPVGQVSIRIIEPTTEVSGVYLHIHGGGWVIGAAHHQDPLNVMMADSTNTLVISVDYRLAPEDPYPAGPDDCEAVAIWLAENAAAEFGTEAIAIGGESAGAHLAAVTMLRMRDKHDYPGFAAANLVYGAYDLSATPSVRSFGDRGLILGTKITQWFTDQFVTPDLHRDPDVSPLFADLSELAPAIFTVGTLDPLLDDTLFMYGRYVAAGNKAELRVWPGAIHAFDYFVDGPQTDQARSAMHEFVNAHL